MEAVTVAIEGKLAMDGARDIDLVVHSFNVGHPSPCVVIEDGVNRGAIGGRIDTLDEIFQSEISRHPGYMVKERGISFWSGTRNQRQRILIKKIDLDD